VAYFKDVRIKVRQILYNVAIKGIWKLERWTGERLEKTA
jgi:hypothetical protein